MGEDIQIEKMEGEPGGERRQKDDEDTVRESMEREKGRKMV